MKKMMLVVMLGLVMIFTSQSFASELTDTVDELGRLQAMTQSGISYLVYRKQLNEVTFRENRYLKSIKNDDPQKPIADKIIEIYVDYFTAGRIWEFAFDQWKTYKAVGGIDSSPGLKIRCGHVIDEKLASVFKMDVSPDFCEEMAKTYPELKSEIEYEPYGRVRGYILTAKILSLIWSHANKGMDELDKLVKEHMKEEK